MVGMVLLWIVMLLMFLIVGVASFSGSKPSVKSNSVLEVDLNNVTVVERFASDDPMSYFQFDDAKTIGLNEWESVLKKAAEDERICGISLVPGNIIASHATLNAMRNALLKFRSKGKFVFAYDNNYSQSAYFLASAADSLFLNPQGVVDIHGMAVQILFFKDLLDKYAVDVQVFRHGSFKSAVEPYMASHMSAENREQMLDYVSSIWSHWSKSISKSRKIPEKYINSAADNLMLLASGQVAQTTHFVNQLFYEDEYNSALQERVCEDTIRNLKINKIDYFDYKKTVTASKSTPYKVAVLYANGNIVEEKGSSEKIGENIVKELRKLRERKDVKAVVMRVNSGGGSALMSDRIWRELVLLKEMKPVVVSMGDYAASGGYYISCAADYIVADPTTITGSIGVFGIIPNLGKTLSNKLGINVETVKTHPYSDISTVTRPMTVYEYNVMQNSVDRVYDTFVKRVADGRNLKVSYVDKIAQGRVWSGKDALGIGLVDTLGGLDVAVAYAAKKAGLANYSIVEYPKIDKFMDTFASSLMQSRQQKLENQWKGTALYPYFRLASSLKELEGVQAILPYQLQFE